MRFFHSEEKRWELSEQKAVTRMHTVAIVPTVNTGGFHKLKHI